MAGKRCRAREWNSVILPGKQHNIAVVNFNYIVQFLLKFRYGQDKEKSSRKVGKLIIL